MGQKSFARDFFCFLVFLDTSHVFYVDSYALSGNSENGFVSSLLDKGSERKEKEGLNLSPWTGPPEWGDLGAPSSNPHQALDDTDEYKKLLKVLTSDKSYNLWEADNGPDNNDSKIIVVSEKDYFKVYESDEEARNGEYKIQPEGNIFHLFGPENFLSDATAEKHSRDLLRIKREAEGGSEKKKCKCRRVMRRNGLRGKQRRRRRRNGQQNQQRRRRQRRGRRRRTGRRRGRRRCVCRKDDGDEGKSDGEESVDDSQGSKEGGEEGEEGAGEGGEEGGEADGGEGGEEGGEGEGGEGEGGGGEGGEDGGEDGEEGEGSDESSAEESSEEEGDEKLPAHAEGGQSPGAIPVPPGSVVLVPGQTIPYPNAIPYPNTMPYPYRTPYPNTMPSFGAIPSGKKL